MTSLRRLARMWDAPGAGYDEFSRGFAAAAAHLAKRLDPARVRRALDVGCGAGLATRAIAERVPDALVIGVDIAPGLIALARAAHTGRVSWCLGDALALPLETGAVDAVASCFGVPFAGRPRAAAAELARVCAPGGRLALTCWLDDEPTRRLACIVADHLAEHVAERTGRRPDAADPPAPWGAPDRVAALLGDAWSLEFEQASCPLVADTGRDAWSALSSQYGPIRAIVAALPPDRRERLARDVGSFYDGFRAERGVSFPRRYLLVTGIRRG